MFSGSLRWPICQINLLGVLIEVVIDGKTMGASGNFEDSSEPSSERRNREEMTIATIKTSMTAEPMRILVLRERFYFFHGIVV